MVAIAFDCKGSQVQFDEDDVAPTLRAMGHNKSHQNGGGQMAIAIQERAVSGNPDQGPQGAGFRVDDCAFTLEARSTPQAVLGVSVAENQRGELRLSDTSPALTIGGGKPGQGYATALVGPRVRRLMPIECERLQGFPDNHTAVTHKGKPAADGPRYKAIGNSMAVPVIKWILDRLAPLP